MIYGENVLYIFGGIFHKRKYVAFCLIEFYEACWYRKYEILSVFDKMVRFLYKFVRN